jgi:hypothetical protein
MPAAPVVGRQRNADDGQALLESALTSETTKRWPMEVARGCSLARAR